jgi:hypothetical protein
MTHLAPSPKAGRCQLGFGIPESPHTPGRFSSPHRGHPHPQPSPNT